MFVGAALARGGSFQTQTRVKEVPVGWDLAAALAASLCYGVASVLQAVGARRVERSEQIDPRLLVRVLGSMPFLAGTALDAVGLCFNLIALRNLTLFTVQALVNTNLAVTAVTAVLVLHARMERRDKLAVTAVICGLVLLCLASGPEGKGGFDTAARYGLLVAAVALAAVALAVANVFRQVHPAVLGALAGFLFGIFGIAVRVIPSLAPERLVTDPAAYAALIASVTGFTFFAGALQRGSVTATTAALVVGETTIPALVGLIALGDTTRRGFAPLGVVGYLLAVGGALALSKYGELIDSKAAESASADYAAPSPRPGQGT
jgi:drug/metabolite transporter (DMT)-like permease